MAVRHTSMLISFNFLAVFICICICDALVCAHWMEGGERFLNNRFDTIICINYPLNRLVYYVTYAEDVDLGC